MHLNLMTPIFPQLDVNIPEGWWKQGAQLDLDFANRRAYNKSTQFRGRPDSILTYSSPSPKMVYGDDGVLFSSSGTLPYDHDPVTLEPLGVLIEEQRTNLLTYSEQFDNAAWTKAAGARTITTDAVTAPDGTTTADQISYTASDYPGVKQTVSGFVAGTSYTFSLWARCPTGTLSGRIEIFGAGVISASTSITLTTTWTRFTVSGTAIGSGTASVFFYPTYAAGQTGTAYMWGAQLEAGAFATSYIPTVASQVTRAADKVMIATSAFGFNATEGTLYTEGRATSTGTVYFAGFSDNGGSDLEYMGNRKSGAGYGANVVDGGVSQASMTTNSPVYAANLEVEMAFAYKANDFANSMDGAAVGTDVSGTLPTVTGLYVGAIRDAANYANGCIKRLTYWNIRKTNAELQGLTI